MKKITFNKILYSLLFLFITNITLLAQKSNPDYRCDPTLTLSCFCKFYPDAPICGGSGGGLDICIINPRLCDIIIGPPLAICGTDTTPPCHCFNNVQDGDEQGEDCGGSCPGICPISTCTLPSTPPCHCENGVQDGNEQGVDCGGSCPDICSIDASCGTDTTPPCHCFNNVQDGDEQGEDCGGSCPDICSISTCFLPWTPPCHCSNGRKDGDETGNDCGGSCEDCECKPIVELQSKVNDNCTVTINPIPGLNNPDACSELDCGNIQYQMTINGNPTTNDYSVFTADESGEYTICLTATFENCNITKQICETFDVNVDDCLNGGNTNHALNSSTSNTSPFTIYPNPTKKQFTLDYELPNPEATGTVSLMNAQGQQVLQQQINGYDIKQQFDVSQLPAGLYFVAIQSEGTVLHQSKLMVNP